MSRDAMPGVANALLVREATGADLTAITAIYAPYVLHGVASFEETPPTVEDMAARRVAVLKAGLPYLVAEIEGRVVGYAYATLYRPRPAYRFTAESSVYVAEGLTGQGVGKRLMQTLIAICERGPWRQLLAVIGNSGNAASLALHASVGFRVVGTFKDVGYKHAQWLDTVLMQRTLGDGATTPPR